MFTPYTHPVCQNENCSTFLKQEKTFEETLPILFQVHTVSHCFTQLPVANSDSSISTVHFNRDNDYLPMQSRSCCLS